MKFLSTILLFCLCLVSAGQAPIIKKVPRLQFTSQTSGVHGFHKLSVNEGAEELAETEHEAPPAEDINEAISDWNVPSHAPHRSNVLHPTRDVEIPLYLRVCQIRI